MKKLIFTLALMFFTGGFAFNSFAQMNLGPEWGETPEVRNLMVRYYNFLSDKIKAKDYNAAAFYLQNIMEKAPAANINLYIRGSILYKDRIKQADDKEQKQMYVDSLMMMYDKGVQYFGDQDPQRKRQFIESKAIDYMNFNATDREGVAKHFREAIETLGNDVDPRIILTYYNELTTDFRNDDVSMEDYLMEFDRLFPLVQSLGTEDQVKQLQTMLAGSGAANCENLEKIYAAQVNERPDDVKLLETVVALLNRASCTGTDFYLKVAELYFKVNPSATTAIIIATYYQANGDYATALRYFNEALQTETDQAGKANLCVNIAALQLQEGSNREAYNFASRAISMDSRNPTAYYLIAMAYANGAKSVQDGFLKQAVYWLVVDNLQQARQYAAANPSAGMSVAQLGNLIAQFQASFPEVDELFMRGLNDGDPYTVSAAWISGKTTVRKRP